MKEPDDIDLQIGIYLGLGFTIAETAARVGRDEGTVSRRRQARPEFVAKVVSWTESGAAETVSKRIREIESKADAKQRLSAQAYANLEKLLAREDLDDLALSAIKEALNRTEGKALDRRAILQQVQHSGRVEIDTRDLDDALTELRSLNTLRNRFLPAAAVEDAEVLQ